MAGINQVFSLADDLTRYLKACGKRSVLETKPIIFRGTNPTLTYEVTGKTFTLPRFISPEMKQARNLNKIATNQIKQYSNQSFPKANIEDLRRLTSETLEESYSRVQWINPKDGKIYNLLKIGKNKKGDVVIRILDAEGAFIKESSLKQKKALIIDYFDGSGADHGDIVLAHAKRNNPFLDFKTIQLDNEENIIELLNKEYFDYINCSFGSRSFINEFWFKLYKLNGSELSLLGLDKNKFLQYTDEDLFKILPTIINKGWFKDGINIRNKNLMTLLNNLAKGKTRVFQASGNEGAKKITDDRYFFRNIEGVGALNSDGKVCDFSASRNSLFTQHYEKGEFKICETPFGLNCTGIPGTDFITNDKNIKNKILLNEYGTSFSTPIRLAKVALSDMLEGII